jgi:hypothetical protein
VITDDFFCVADSRVLLRPPQLSYYGNARIAPAIAVIAAGAFSGNSFLSTVDFEIGSSLREIGAAAFAGCSRLKAFHIPPLVETIGDRCFERCSSMHTIRLEGCSKLKRIGERAFAESGLTSVTIPASTEEIDGSAFIGCPISQIRVAPGNVNFRIEGEVLVASEGTEIVRYFGQELEVVVRAKLK